MKEVTIVGAGLVGSLLAVLLAKRGYKVSLYERRPDMRQTDISAGKSINLALSDRGLKALALAGLDAKVKELAIPMHGRIIHKPGAPNAFQAYGQEGQYINSVSRGGLNMLLMDAAEKEGVKLRFNQRCLAIKEETHEVVFQDFNTGEKTKLKPDLIFGADGAFSAVRASMQHNDRFNYSQFYLEHGYKELVIPTGDTEKWQIDKNALHIWPRHSFMLIALPNLDGSFTCTLFLPFEGPASFANLTDGKSLLRFFEEHFADVVPLMPTLMDDFFTNPTSSLVTVKCRPWTYNGRIALIGDAAHAIVPFYGQGMNAGFEDCTVLCELMDQHGDDWATIMKAYQEARQDNGDAIADLAIKNFMEMRDKVADPVFLKRKAIEKKLEEKFPGKFISQYSMVTFSHLPYADAWKEGLRQDELFSKIMTIDNIEERWDEPEILAEIEAWLN